MVSEQIRVVKLHNSSISCSFIRVPKLTVLENLKLL